MILIDGFVIFIVSRVPIFPVQGAPLRIKNYYVWQNFADVEKSIQQMLVEGDERHSGGFAIASFLLASEFVERVN